jgi:hypothetical protein
MLIAGKVLLKVLCAPTVQQVDAKVATQKGPGVVGNAGSRRVALSHYLPARETLDWDPRLFTGGAGWRR